MNKRLNDIDRFYELIRQLAHLAGGPRRLADCARHQDWPMHGVYFFFEQGETRPDRSFKPRIVRVGTHGLIVGSKSTIYGRLSQHRGTLTGGGNHRGSVFRLHVGNALLRRDAHEMRCNTWGRGSNAPREIRLAERSIEEAVSRYIGNMELLWFAIPDEPGPSSARGYIERNTIALLAGKEPASPTWLGFQSGNASIIRSYLWNVKHIDHRLEVGFLDSFETRVHEMAKGV